MKNAKPKKSVNKPISILGKKKTQNQINYRVIGRNSLEDHWGDFLSYKYDLSSLQTQLLAHSHIQYSVVVSQKKEKVLRYSCVLILLTFLSSPIQEKSTFYAFFKYVSHL